MAVRIITDSTSDISQEQAKERGITVIPLRVRFGEREYCDGVDLTPGEFYKKLVSSQVLPTTSQLSPGDFKEHFRRIRDAGDSAVVILLSGELSGTVQSAVIAKEACGYDEIYLVNSLSATIGLRLLVELADALRGQGKAAWEIALAVEKARARERLHAVVDTLEYLKKGGRLSKTAAFAGTLLGIKPIIGVENGKVEVQGKARGLQKAYSDIFALIEQDGGVDLSLPYALGYAGSEENLAQFRPLVFEKIGGEPLESPIGSTIGTHVGPGACAIAYFAKE